MGKGDAMMQALKRMAGRLVLVLLAAAFMEIVVVLAFVTLKRSTFPYAGYRERMQARVAIGRENSDNGSDPGMYSGEILHPYLGFTLNPETTGISPFGFANLRGPLLEPSSNLTVAVIGGSFAMLTCVHSEQALVDGLKPLGVPVSVLNLALGGYKEPQQVMTLAYFLSLGAHFDIVINIDGFNEVALPPAQNIPNGVFPLYPRQWHLRMRNIHEPELAPKLLRLEALRARKATLASHMEHSFLSHTALGCITWLILDRKLDRNEYALQAQIGETRADARPIVTGPPFPARSEAEVYAFLADHWARCSRLLNDLCRTRGIAYFHFLQPNQYDEGSKPIGPEEARIALDPNHHYRPGVVQGYPLLRAAGVGLAKEMHFYDMTMIFTNHSEVLYRDTCCHLNKQGFDLFAAEVGRNIAQAILESGRPREQP